MQRLADTIIVLWGWRRLSAAAAAGAVSALAMAPFHAFPVLWLTLPILVWLLDGATADDGAGALKRLLPAAAIGWWFGFGYFLAGMWWIGAAFTAAGGAFLWLAPLAVVGLPAALAVFWAVGAAAARLAWSDGPERVLTLAIAMGVAEWLRGHLFTGLPWNALGLALAPTDIMMQSASLVGLWGLTLAAFFVFAAPAALSSAPVRRPAAGYAVVAGAVALLVAHVGYGYVRLLSDPAATPSGPHIRIVQPAVPQSERWGVERSADVMGRLIALSAAEGAFTAAEGPKVLVWPESAFPFFLTENSRALGSIADLLLPGTSLITGAARIERQGGEAAGSRAFNSVFVLDDRGEIRDAYDKVHLVPFGEYLPGGALVRALGLTQLVALPGGFLPGAQRRSLSLPDGTVLGPSICYEIIFPGAVTDARQRPDWLVNVTNDAWFANTPGPYQHFHQARLRAVEEGLPLVRSANSGISAIVDSYGRVAARLAFAEMGFVDGKLPAGLAPTIYARIRDVSFALMVAAFLLAIMAVGLTGRKW